MYKEGSLRHLITLAWAKQKVINYLNIAENIYRYEYYDKPGILIYCRSPQRGIDQKTIGNIIDVKHSCSVS